MQTHSLAIIALFSLATLGVQAANPDAGWLQLAAAGPGTQTEDELYIGARMKREAAKAARQQEVQAKQPKKAAKPLKSGDEDLEDLEVQRAR